MVRIAEGLPQELLDTVAGFQQDGQQDLHAQSFLSSQNVGALAKAFVEEFVKTSALQQVMASAIDGRLSNVATHQDVAELQQDLQDYVTPATQWLKLHATLRISVNRI
ncbi:TPA: hypothetical protein ACH3X2_009439 [Trebouxia sp. C0005]